MGSMKGLLGMIPGVGSQLKDAEVDERQLARVEAVVLSMTPQERRLPGMIDGKRRARIAAGSGTTVAAGQPGARDAQADGADAEADAGRQGDAPAGLARPEPSGQKAVEDVEGACQAPPPIRLRR